MTFSGQITYNDTKYGKVEKWNDMDYGNIGSVSKLPLNEQVYRALVELITNGEIPPGTELKEQHLAKKMNVSATPVREAIRRLASDGFVETIPYRGSVVRTLNQQEIAEAYACREALERLAVAEAIGHLEDGDIDTLYELVESYRSMDDPTDIYESSQKFDNYIYALSHNQTLHDLLGMLKGTIGRDKKYSAANVERREEIYSEHRAIIQAMEERDAEKAKEAVSRHIQNGRRFIEGKG